MVIFHILILTRLLIIKTETLYQTRPIGCAQAELQNHSLEEEEKLITKKNVLEVAMLSAEIYL